MITARVPSLPINRRVRSYPAELFRALDPVRTIVPSASTAVRFSTFSLILPYRTAVEPLIESECREAIIIRIDNKIYIDKCFDK